MTRVGQGVRQREIGYQFKETVDGQIIEGFEGCDKDFGFYQEQMETIGSDMIWFVTLKDCFVYCIEHRSYRNKWGRQETAIQKHSIVALATEKNVKRGFKNDFNIIIPRD